MSPPPKPIERFHPHLSLLRGKQSHTQDSRAAHSARRKVLTNACTSCCRFALRTMKDVISPRHIKDDRHLPRAMTVANSPNSLATINNGSAIGLTTTPGPTFYSTLDIMFSRFLLAPRILLHAKRGDFLRHFWNVGKGPSWTLFFSSAYDAKYIHMYERLSQVEYISCQVACDLSILRQEPLQPVWTFPRPWPAAFTSSSSPACVGWSLAMLPSLVETIAMLMAHAYPRPSRLPLK